MNRDSTLRIARRSVISTTVLLSLMFAPGWVSVTNAVTDSQVTSIHPVFGSQSDPNQKQQLTTQNGQPHNSATGAVSVRYGLGSDRLSTISFTSLAQFYKTNWFRVSCVLGALLIVSIGIRMRSRKIHQRDAALRESQERYSDIFNATHDAIFIRDAKTGEVLDVNERTLELFKYTREQALRSNLGDISSGIEPYTRAEAQKRVQQAISESPQLFQWHAKRSDGTLFWVEVSLRSTTIAGEQRVLATIRDITERRRANSDLEEKQKQLDSLLSNVGVIVLEGDPYNIYYVGGQVERILGYPKKLWFEDPDGPVGFWAKHLHADDVGCFDICRRAIERGEDHSFEYRMIAANGREVWFFDTVTVETENGKPVKARSVMVDISDRKRAELSLRESEKRFDQAFRGSGVGLWDSDLISGREYWSPFLFEQLGYEPDEFVPTFEFFREMIHPDERQRIMDELTAHFESRVPYASQCRLRTKSGEYRWFRTTGTATWDQDGTPVRLIGTAEDITDRKLADERQRKLENRLRQAQKMEAIGQLAGGVSHDIRNVLTAIMGYAEIARNHRQNEPVLTEAIDGIIKSADEAAEVTKSLLTFGGQKSSEKETVDLGTVVTESIQMLRHMLPASIQIETEIPSGEQLTVMGNSTQLRQVIVNLMLNARDAMPKGGQIRVRIRSLVALGIGDGNDLNSGQRHQVELEVEDSGCGMSEETLARAFEPFFTTKPRGKGTGLGLAMVHGIVGDHDAKIDVYSVVNQGTRISIVFPGHEATVDKPAATITGNSVHPGSGETLLLVEDHEQVRSIMVKSLEGAGYNVLQAVDGQQGIEVFTAHQDAIKLLILDVNLPKMDGISVLNAARESAPQVAAMIITGGDIAHVRESVGQDVAILQKPVRMSNMLEVVSRTLADDVARRDESVQSPRTG